MQRVTVLLASLLDDGTALRIAGEGRRLDVHAIWVRDACCCPVCRRPATNERRLDATTVDLDVLIETVAVDAAGLAARTSDDHDVFIPADVLLRQLREHDRRLEPAAEHSLWGGEHRLARIGRDELDDPAGRLTWLDRLWADGAVIVTGMPTEPEALEAVAEMVGPIRPTNYERLWSIEAVIDAVSEVESTHDLLVHTDLPYRHVAPGVQLLLAAITDVAGGATTLRDGYHVAEQLRHEDVDAWDLLTRVEWTYPYVRDHVEHHGRAPLIQLRPDGTYFQIRRAPDLVGVPHVGVDETPALYRALRRWTELVDDVDQQVTYRLEPGEMLCFHNHRLLHGRTAFDLGGGGRRRLLGCYLDIEELHSARALLARDVPVGH